MASFRARTASRVGPGSVTGTAPRASTGSGRSWGKSLPLRSGESPECMGRAPLPPGSCGSRSGSGGRDRGETPCPEVVRVAHGCCAVLLRSFALYYAPFNRAVGFSCRGGGQSPPLAGACRGGMLARWCGWGSWDDSGRAFVQICCKGAPGRDRPREEARNINDSPPAPRRDRGLCNRFGQTMPPRASRRGAEGRMAISRAASPTRVSLAWWWFPRGLPPGGPPRPREAAPDRLLRPFTLRCTRRRGVAEGEGAQQREKSVVDAGPAAGFSAFSGAWRRWPRRGAGGSPGVRASGRCAPSRRTSSPGPPTPRRRRTPP